MVAAGHSAVGYFHLGHGLSDRHFGDTLAPLCGFLHLFDDGTEQCECTHPHL